MKKLFLFFALSLFSLHLHAQVLVHGKVKSRGKGIPGYRVYSRYGEVVTGKGGKFTIEVAKLGDTVFIPNQLMIADGRRMVFKIRHHRYKQKYLHGGCCFAAGTSITLKDGKQKNIENISTGDSVLTMNTVTQEIETARVNSVDSVRHNNLVKLEFENGMTVLCTDDHPVYILGKGWHSVSPEKTLAHTGMNVLKLKAGDECVIMIKNELTAVKLKGIVPLTMSIMTYNISGLSRNASYFANGVLVSNESNDPHIVQH